MNSLLPPLYELHLIDDRIYRSRQGLAALDAPSPLAQQLGQLDTELAKYETALKKAKVTLQDLELQVKTLEDRKKNDHQKLYSGKIVGTRELQALEHEIETLSASISATEDRVLEAMEKVEPLQAAVEKLRGYKKTAEEKLTALRAQQETDRKRLQADLAQAEPLRPAAVKAVDPALFRSYEGIRRERKHPGLSVIKDNSCGHCHTSLPSFVLRRLREEDEIIQCDNCTRIYYLPNDSEAL